MEFGHKQIKMEVLFLHYILLYVIQGQGLKCKSIVLGTKIIFWDLRDSFLLRLYHGTVEGSRLENLLPHIDSVSPLSFPLHTYIHAYYGLIWWAFCRFLTMYVVWLMIRLEIWWWLVFVGQPWYELWYIKIFITEGFFFSSDINITFFML